MELKLFTVIAIILFNCVIISNAALYIQKATRHRDYPDRCHSKLLSIPMIPSKEYNVKGICASATCNIDTLTVSIATCPYIEAPGCEELPMDLSRAYPKCCPQFVCRDTEVESGSFSI